MKRLQQLKGMPVLSLQEGEVLGRVREAIIDTAAGRVVALTLDRRTPGGEHQVVATANIRSVGKEAITVEDRTSVVPISRIPRFKELAQKGKPLRGRVVMTEGGSRLGRVGDVTVDESNFHLTSFILQAFWGRGQVIPMERVRAIGTDVVVVWEAPEVLPAPVPPAVEATPPSSPPEEIPSPPLPTEEKVPPPPPAPEGAAEPAIPLVSLPEESRPAKPAEPGEGVPAEVSPPSAGPENPWQRWIHRLLHRM